MVCGPNALSVSVTVLSFRLFFAKADYVRKLNFSFIAPPGPTIELTPEMNALKNQLLFDVQQAIRREVTRAVNRTTAMMKQRFDAKIMQIFDDIFRTQSEDEVVDTGVSFFTYLAACEFFTTLNNPIGFSFFYS